MDIYHKISELNTAVRELPEVRQLSLGGGGDNASFSQPVEISSPAQCSYCLEEIDTVSAMLALPNALRFTHGYVINANDHVGVTTQHDPSARDDDITWCASGIAVLLKTLSVTPEFGSVFEKTIECLAWMLHSWNSSPAFCSQAAAQDLCDRNSSQTCPLPPTAVFLSELFSKKVRYGEGYLFDVLIDKWAAPEQECNVVNANWILFCLCVRTATSDEAIFRNPHVLQLVFNRERTQSHLLNAKECPYFMPQLSYNKMHMALLGEPL